MFKWAFNKIVKLREKVAVDLGGEDVEKPFLSHLDDLRTMIVRMVVTLLVVTIGAFTFHKDLLAILRYPIEMAGLAGKVDLQNFKVVGGFMTVMNISLVAAVIIAFPLLLYFLLQFVLPGLRSNEKKVIFPALGVGAGLFLLGVVFAYYVVTPRALKFFYEFSFEIGMGAPQATAPPTPGSGTAPVDPKLAGQLGILWESKIPGVTNSIEGSVDGQQWTALSSVGPDGKPVEAKDIRFVRITSAPSAIETPAGTTPAVTPPLAAASIAAAKPFIWELTEYVKFVCQFVLIFGACFELPVVVMALVKLDVLNYKVMKNSRAWAAIIIAMVAAFITPTQDALTLGLLAGPMYLLYEICIWLAWWLEKKDRQLYPEYYKDRDEDEKALEVSDDWDNENYNPLGQDDSDEEDEYSSSASKTAAKSPAPPAETVSTAEPSAAEEPSAPTGPASEEPMTEASPSGATPPPESQTGAEGDTDTGDESLHSGDDAEGEKKNTDWKNTD